MPVTMINSMSHHHNHSEKHFALHTLYCNYNLDIGDIIIAQPGLQTIGIYSNGDFDILINTLEHVRANSGSLPSLPTFLGVRRVINYSAYNTDYPGYNDMETYILAAMTHAHGTSRSYPELFLTSRSDHPTRNIISFDRPTHNVIDIFPAFLTGGLYPWRTIAESIDRDPTYNIPSIVKIRIYLKDFSDVTFVYRLLEEMAHIFPNISDVVFLLQCYPEVVSPCLDFYITESALISTNVQIPDLSTMLPRIAPLTSLTLSQPLTSLCRPTFPNEAKFAFVDAWAIKCPDLNTINFPDGSVFVRNGRDPTWNVS